MRTQSVLCILSDASVRPLDGIIAAVLLAFSYFLPVTVVSASWYVPARHERKSSYIEQAIVKSTKQLLHRQTKI